MIKELDGEVEKIYTKSEIEKIEETIELTEELVKDYCMENVPNFRTKGQVIRKTTFLDGNIHNEISVKYNGRDIDKEYALGISKFLEEHNQDIGWELNED